MFVTALTLSNSNRQIVVDTRDPNKTVIIKPNMTFVMFVFLVEFALFLWALTLALKCGKTKNERFLHFILAFFFPIIYILYYYISGCGNE
jgi:hypothetical protein